MSAVVNQLKADFFKTMGHPARIRVLELLGEREHSVSEMLADVGVGASNLSHQLAVLRLAGLVMTRKEGSGAYYSLTTPRVTELLAVLDEMLSEQMDVMTELLAHTSPADIASG